MADCAHSRARLPSSTPLFIVLISSSLSLSNVSRTCVFISSSHHQYAFSSHHQYAGFGSLSNSETCKTAPARLLADRQIWVRHLTPPPHNPSFALSLQSSNSSTNRNRPQLLLATDRRAIRERWPCSCPHLVCLRPSRFSKPHPVRQRKWCIRTFCMAQ